MTEEPPDGGSGRSRLLLALGMAGAWFVALVFIFVGDGVEPSGSGVARVVTEYGHQAVWVLLALSLTWALVRRGWNRVSSALAVTALAVYAAFLLAMLAGS